MEIKALCERQDDGWLIAVPELDNFRTTAKRLDKATEQIKALAENITGESKCDIVVKVEAVMPGIICDIEAAQQKMADATRLQEEASAEIRDVVGRMRDRGLTMRDIAVLLGVTPQCKIPPGAKTAIIKTYAQVDCPNGESVSKTMDGYSISLKSDTSDLLLELTSSQKVNQSLDASALLGPVVWLCEKGRISLSAWEDLGLRDFSGFAIYEKMHDFGADVPAFVELEIGGIEGSLRVLVNDRLAGYALRPKISIPLDGLLVPGVNKFAVESANTLVNLFSRLPSPYSTMQKPSGGFTKATLKLGSKN